MPLYGYQCATCQDEREIVCSVKDYGKKVPRCCGKAMSRVLTPSYAVEDIKPYKSMMTGEWITSRSQHRAHLKQHGVIEVGNEFNKATERPRSIRGDFNVTEDLKRATHQVLSQHRKRA